MSGPPRSYRPHAAAAAWLWPGLGHIVCGERRRGMLIMFGVLFLVVSGLLIGGLDAVDSRNDRLWFLAQALCGPLIFGIDLLRGMVMIDPPPNWYIEPNWAARYADWQARYLAGEPGPMTTIRRTGIGHVNEIGTLFIALAGLMNVAVMLDALCPRPHPIPGRREGDPS